MNPTFTIYTGPMFSAKTTSLLSALDRYKYQGKKIMVFKPKLDDRYSVDNISTHSGWTFPAICVKFGENHRGRSQSTSYRRRRSFYDPRNCRRFDLVVS